MRRPRIIAFAYSVRPGEGSEGGAGWTWSRLLAGLGDVWVVTRSFDGREAALARAAAVLPEAERPRMVYVAIPAWCARTGAGGSPAWARLEYLLWQLLALRVARRLHREWQFDLAWHLVYANAWIGSLASLIGPPFVYGPVGGGVAPPLRLLASLGASGIGNEVFRALGRTLGRWVNPVARVSWRRASLVLAQNPETRAWLPHAVQARTVVMPNAVLDEPLRAMSRHRATHVALYAGRLLPLKGVALAIRTIAQLPGWRLIICGQGPDRARLVALTRELGLMDRVELRGQVPRPELLRVMREEAEVLLFPSLHDEGCWTALEAASSGIPTVCLDRGAPALVATVVVRSGWIDETVRALARGVRDAGSLPPRSLAFDMASRRVELARLLAERGLPVDAPPASEAQGRAVTDRAISK